MFIYTTKAGMHGGRRPVHLSFSSRTCSPDGRCSLDHSANLAQEHSPTRQLVSLRRRNCPRQAPEPPSVSRDALTSQFRFSVKLVRSKQSQMNSSGQNMDCETIKLDEYVVGG